MELPCLSDMFDILGCINSLNQKSNIFIQRRESSPPTAQDFWKTERNQDFFYTKIYFADIIKVLITVLQEADENLNFDEMILEAAKSSKK